MPRSSEANQQIREAQRAKILKSARKVFARKGMAATITDIAAEAQVSIGLAYRYFADKDAIFSELVRQTIPDDATGVQRLLEMPGTPGERLTTLVSGMVAARKHPELIEVYQLFEHTRDAAAFPGEVRELLGKRYQALLDTMKQLIIEGQATGEVAPGDPDQLVAILGAFIDGLTRWAMRDPEQFSTYVPDAEIIMRIFAFSKQEEQSS